MGNEFVKSLLKYVDDTTEALMDDPDRYKAFLAYLSRMDSQLGISNKMLIYGYDREATDIRTVMAWNMTGITVLQMDKPIYILTGKDSSEYGRSFMEVFDIKYTNAVKRKMLTFQDSGSFAEAVMAAAPCILTFTDKKLENKLKCFYDFEKQEIFMTNDYKDFDEISQNLLREYAHFYLEDIYRKIYLNKLMNDMSRLNADNTQSRDEQNKPEPIKLAQDTKAYNYNREAHNAEALSASYMVCKRYQQKPLDIPFIRRNPSVSINTLRAGLENMDIAFRNIIKTIEEGRDAFA